MNIKFRHILGIIIGLGILVLDFIYFFNFQEIVALSRFFSPLIAISLIVGSLQFWIDLFRENRRQKEIEEQFLEFVRNLVGTVRSGITIPKSIIHVSKEDYGALSPYVKKLANQISWGVPTVDALLVFAKDTKNKVVKRSISIVIEATRSGGNMVDVLQAVTDSVIELKKIKEERRSATYSQIVEGYIIFFVFIIIMIILQLKMMPYLEDISNVIGGGADMATIGLQGGVPNTINMNRIFLWLIEIQGLFMGLVIGKFAEGEMKYGIKHSLILIASAFIIVTAVVGK